VVRRIVILTAGVLMAVLPACTATDPGIEQRHSLNAWLGDCLNDDAVNNAIVAQRTLFPYHFVTDTAKLNELGSRDLAVLAAHFTERSGKLNVRRGTAPEELYVARVATVIDALASRGVASDRVAISDGLAEGEGMASEDVLFILENKEKLRTTGGQVGRSVRGQSMGAGS
jgi:hypothetical protein